MCMYLTILMGDMTVDIFLVRKKLSKMSRLAKNLAYYHIVLLFICYGLVIYL